MREWEWSDCGEGVGVRGLREWEWIDCGGGEDVRGLGGGTRGDGARENKQGEQRECAEVGVGWGGQRELQEKGEQRERKGERG